MSNLVRFSKLEFDPFGRHNALDKDDECYYLGDYTAGAGYAHSGMNQIILNLKKPVQSRGQSDWIHKQNAIVRLAKIIEDALKRSNTDEMVIIPIPPSKIVSDLEYDDRLLQILQRVESIKPENIRNALIAERSINAAHLQSPGQRPSVSDIEKLLTVDESLFPSMPRSIWIFDDVITSGAHFKAAKNLLQRLQILKNVPIQGLFIARTVRGPDADLTST